MRNTIFIAIASLNEKDLIQTINSAINNAANPEKLYFGVSSQTYTKEQIKDFTGLGANLRVIHTVFGGPTGVGLPRIITNMLTDFTQDFYLQLDSHMIFENNWDVELLKAYYTIKNKFEKPIISSYTPWFYEDSEGRPRLGGSNTLIEDPNNFKGYPGVSTCKLIVDDYNTPMSTDRKHIPIGGANINWDKEDNDYVEHHLISAAFLFTSINFITDVLPDPLLLFGGEEPSCALRAWTRGYRIFTIRNPLIWHKNKFGDTPDLKDWRIRSNSPDQSTWDLFDKKYQMSLARVRDIFLGNILGYWGAPTKELLDLYEEALGVSFSEYYDKVPF
jgi:hypothetical protein